MVDVRGGKRQAIRLIDVGENFSNNFGYFYACVFHFFPRKVIAPWNQYGFAINKISNRFNMFPFKSFKLS